MLQIAVNLCLKKILLKYGCAIFIYFIYHENKALSSKCCNICNICDVKTSNPVSIITKCADTRPVIIFFDLSVYSCQIFIALKKMRCNFIKTEKAGPCTENAATFVTCVMSDSKSGVHHHKMCSYWTSDHLFCQSP